ncbi:protein LIAT1 isoform X2 [Anabas testudineus]|nr:protein LIAT1 isoform X2 [Anabas testudineus]
MPEDKTCKVLQPPKSCDNNKKRKKRIKKTTVSISPPENEGKPQTVSLPPETSTVSLLPPRSPGQDRSWGSKLRATGKKDGERLCGSSRRRKKHPKDSPAPLSATNKTSSRGAAAQGFITELSAKESVRWEGVLEDPQAEEKRLELYRANRRQRYIAYREALLKETQESLRQSFPKKSTEKKAFTGTNQQETVSLLQLSID